MLFKLVKYLKNYKIQVIIGPLFKLLEAILELIVPIVMAHIIDIGVNAKDSGYVLRMGGVMVLLAAVGLASALTCQRLAATASQGFGTDVRNALFGKINTFSHAEIDRFGTSSLITRVTNDVNQLQLAVAMLIRLVIRAPFLAVGAVVMSVILDPELSLVFLVATPIIALILYFIMTRSVPFYRMIQKKLDRLSLISLEGVSGARVIRAFSRQRDEIGRFQESGNDLANTAVRVGRLSVLLNPLCFVAINFAVMALLWFGGLRVQVGTLTQGTVIALVNYMTQTLLAVIVLADLVVVFTKAAASAARVNEVLETVPSVREGGAESLEPVRDAPKIEFKEVSLAYDGSGERAVRGLTFTVEPGETVGIIGGTGSGKTTLVNLIPRFYDATQGEIYVDGRNVKEYTFDDLRGKMGIVPQQAALFTGTIEDNLRMGNEHATEEELKHALQVAQAWEFVERLPAGLKTVLNEGGKNLSGGQKQRLTIARALAKIPQILILDDSFSALDFATDAALRAALKKETERLTVLMVSQRAGSVRSADKIIVLDDGEIAGIGKHGELYENCPVYREICDSQSVGVQA